VIDANELVLLDTNVILYLLRGKAAGRWLNETYELGARAERPLVSVVVVGEILAFAARQRYGDDKREALPKLLGELVVVDVKSPIAREYARLQAMVQGAGTPIGENDIWIAATAAATASTVLTKDKHFRHVPPGLVKVEIYELPESCRS
jgi:tRNA(fMet)-specific endonuclease VapC